MTATFKNVVQDEKSKSVASTEHGQNIRLGSPHVLSVESHTHLIAESHARCQHLGLRSYEPCDFSTQMLADFRVTLERNSRLLAQAASVVEMLGKRVGDFGSMIVLTDGTGTILRTRCQSTFIEPAEKVALRPGVSWAESSKGTNAVGTALLLESDISVHGHEHYIQSNHFLTCAASLIKDHSGNVIGVLNVSGDNRSFHPHTMMLVEMCARTIENNWFRDKFRHAMQLHFHTQAELIGTAEEGSIVFGEDGKILGVNRSGLKMLEVGASALRIQGLRMVFGLGFGELMDKLRLATFTPLQMHLSNGREVTVRVSWNEATISANNFSMPSRQLPAPPAVSASPVPIQKSASPAKKTPYQLDDLDFGDAVVRSVTQKVRHIIDKDISILILGETGTGKELLANAIHQYSQRRDKPFVAINCASIPEQLIESELFGYEEGAFTGAKRKGAAGKLLQANGGTLFLDEIGDMPLSLQARLLRVLQERKVVPLGGHRPMDIDVNLICATHRNLRELINERGFRDDLYYRINGISVKLPRLRDRTDLAALCQKILHELSPHRALGIQPALMKAFLRYSWPGNLRQLNNVLKTAVIMASSDHEITPMHLADDFVDELSPLIEAASHTLDASIPSSFFDPSDRRVTTQQDNELTMATASLPMTDNLEQVEISTIRRVLEACGGNISTASKQLNISRNTIYRKLKKQE